ncbi:MAG TPA: VWA domain-containing protein [Acidobacteriota bacterium]|nr:VWA domain-containing protein [Acidobacteriota bacterium]
MPIWTRLASSLLFLALLAVPQLWAQESKPPPKAEAQNAHNAGASRQDEQGGEAAESDAVFRSETTLVPLDVIVVDAQGNPVLDLGPDDFRVLENGKPQPITHFSLERYSSRVSTDIPQQGDKHQSRPARVGADPQADSPALQAPDSRTFLLVMGHVPVKEELGTFFNGVDRLIDFVQGLESGDRLALMAYDRITDFTTDHQALVETLRRYRKIGVSIEASLAQRNSHGLFASQKTKELPASLDAKAEKIFDSERLQARQTVKPFIVSEDERRRENLDLTSLSFEELADSLVQRAEALEQAGVEAEAIPSPNNDDQVSSGASVDRQVLSPTQRARLSLITDLDTAEHLSRRASGDLDLNTIFSAIEYLRFDDREKHLIFMSPNGMLLPRTEHYEEVAELAAHYRIRIHTIHTGKLFARSATGFSPYRSPLQQVLNPSNSINPAGTGQVGAVKTSLSQTDAIEALRKVAEITGGSSHLYEDVGEALRRTEEITRASYLLGYVPAGSLDGTYRNIEVKVNRPGMDVMTRSGYFAYPSLGAANQKKLQTYVRTVAAVSTERLVDDVHFQVEVKPGGGLEPGQTLYRVDLNIHLQDDMLEMSDGYRKGELMVAYFFKSQKKGGLWPVWDRVVLSLDQEQYRDTKENGIVFTKSFRPPVEVSGGWLKVVVYDLKNDRLGTLTERLYAPAVTASDSVPSLNSDGGDSR